MILVNYVLLLNENMTRSGRNFAHVQICNLIGLLELELEPPPPKKKKKKKKVHTTPPPPQKKKKKTQPKPLHLPGPNELMNV